jgi:hypothetical protein
MSPHAGGVRKRHLAQLAGLLCAVVALALMPGLVSGTQAGDEAPALQAQSTPTPGFGPIVGPNYTPAPLTTPLPAELHPPVCRVVIAAPELPIYAQPDSQGQAVATAHSADRLVVSGVSTGADGTPWAQVESGWIQLTSGTAQGATLEERRSCYILEGIVPNTTLAGLHLVNGTSGPQVLQLVRRMQESGTPLGTLKGLNGAEDVLRQAKQISPQTVTVFRSLVTSDGLRDCPADLGTTDDMATSAKRWMDSLAPYWVSINADYFEYMNECGSTADRETQFAIEMMKLANAQGRCLLLFSFTAGQPDLSEIDAYLPALKFAAENPCQPGRTHGIAMHESSFQDNVMLSEGDPFLAFRHRKLHETLLAKLPEAAALPIYITEAGVGGGGYLNTPTCEMTVRDIVQYTYLAESDPYVRGFEWWSIGSGTPYYDLTSCLDGIGTALIAYYGH